jgi:tetratricopeptide (TPR) repeat protein
MNIADFNRSIATAANLTEKIIYYLDGDWMTLDEPELTEEIIDDVEKMVNYFDKYFDATDLIKLIDKFNYNSEANWSRSDNLLVSQLLTDDAVKLIRRTKYFMLRGWDNVDTQLIQRILALDTSDKIYHSIFKGQFNFINFIKHLRLLLPSLGIDESEYLYAIEIHQELPLYIQSVKQQVDLEDGVQYYLNLGVEKYNVQDYQRAIYHFNRTIELDHLNADAHYFRERATYLLVTAPSSLDDRLPS